VPPFSLQTLIKQSVHIVFMFSTTCCGVLTELLNVVMWCAVRSAACGDVLPCALVESYQLFRQMCCH
jgi:hypothetical protein